MAAEDSDILICRSLAPKMAFVLGFGRSNTTIVLTTINSAPRALMLGEANFYLQPHQPRFRDWYNAMHAQYGNQVTKSSYAPDFVPNIEHSYAEWLLAASPYYDVIGDKLAFSSQHFGLRSPALIRSFYEARFFTARYILTLREPVQNLLSILRLFGRSDPLALRQEMIAWLSYVQLWADHIRTFPNTLTIAGDIGADESARILDFLGLSSPEASRLVDREEKRNHGDPGRHDDLARHGAALSEIYDHCLSAISEGPVYWQAGQKMTLAMNDTPI